MRALMLGRFQPFHNGHFKVVQEILSEVESVIICIGSAQYSHTEENPFSAEERELMIRRTLDELSITNYSIVLIEDIHNPPAWVKHVEARVPSFDVVYAKSEETKLLFREAGHEVREPYLYDRSRYSGTEIRRRMLEDEEWKSLVPKGTADIIEEINGISRIKALKKES